MLPRNQRLTTTQFDRAFANSQQVRHPLVALRAHFRGDGEETIRAAFVVPKKQAKKASRRNLIRRRLRERYRLHPAQSLLGLQGCDLIFMATPQTADASTAELDAALEEVMRRAAKKNRAAGDGSVPLNSGPQRDASQRDASQRDASQRDVSRRDTLPMPSNEEDANAEPAGEPTVAGRSTPVAVALGLIRFYQRFISPGLPPSCRFEPTCSRYTYASIERFGLLRGCLLGTARVCRCHPWHSGGYDPVPQVFPFHLSRSQK
jgi:putative membrane protein insertion efficiency factor/ribonuclease P protein component